MELPVTNVNYNNLWLSTNYNDFQTKSTLRDNILL